MANKNKKQIKIRNMGTLATDIAISLEINSSPVNGVDLADVIWASFDGGATKFNIKDINDQINLDEFQLLKNDGQPNGKDTKYFNLTYGMETSAGNEYQDKSFTMDLSIMAKQSTYEKDGFGSDQYDANAEYDIPNNAIIVPTTVTEGGVDRPITATELKSMIEANLDGYFVLSDDIDLGGESMKSIGYKLGAFTGTFDGNGHKISNVEFKQCAMFDVIEGATVKNLTLENIQAGNKGYDVTGLLAHKANTKYEDTIISNITVNNACVNSSSTAAFMIASSDGLTQGVDRYVGKLIMDEIHIKDTVFRAYYGVGLFVYAYDHGPQVKITNSTVENSYLDPGSNDSGDVDIASADLEKLALYSRDDTYIYDVDNYTLKSIHDAYSAKSIFNDGSLGYGEDHTSKVSYDLGKITKTFDEYKALVRKNVTP